MVQTLSCPSVEYQADTDAVVVELLQSFELPVRCAHLGVHTTFLLQKYISLLASLECFQRPGSMLASLLPHPKGCKFDQEYLTLQAGPDASKRLESCVTSALGVSAAPALYKLYRLTSADGTSKLVHAATSYPDAADFILNFEDELLKDSVDSDGNPAVWALVTAASRSAAAAGSSASAAVSATDQAGSTVTAAAAAGAGTQPGNGIATQQGAAVIEKAEPVPKIKEWQPLAIELLITYMPCILDPTGPRGIKFLRKGQAIQLDDAEGG